MECEARSNAYKPGSHDQTPSDRSLYVGNLDDKVDREMLKNLFSTVGPVTTVKIVKRNTIGGAAYGFVVFEESRWAEEAIPKLNGFPLLNNEIKVNWAYPSQNNKEETIQRHHLFVGDLSSAITDLSEAFSQFGEIAEAKIVMDPVTKRSKGYGFISFKDKQDAERAMIEMNGKLLGDRIIKVNWANQKINGDLTKSTQSLGNTSVYIGNLSSDVQVEHIHKVFCAFGVIVNIKLFADRGIAFVKFTTHQAASDAILNMNHKDGLGMNIIKCSWGKEKSQQTNHFEDDAPPGFSDVPPVASNPVPWQWNLSIGDFGVNT